METINSLFTSRKKFLYQLGHLTLGVVGVNLLSQCNTPVSKRSSSSSQSDLFTVSLATYSLHRAVEAGQIDNLDFPMIARTKYDIGVLEHLNGYFMDKAEDISYLNQLMQRCSDYDITNHLIMCDNEGSLGDLDDSKKKQAVENHFKWVNAAHQLGCTSIRVNVHGEGSAAEVASAAVDGLGRLGEYASTVGINILVENHGGYTSNAAWLATLLATVNMQNVGALPDFGNFCLGEEFYDTEANRWLCSDEYDRYQGIAELMPFAKGISAKSYDFDHQGNCVETDYVRALRIIKDSGYRGYLGIEYEGANLDEDEGIRKTKALLDRVIAEIG